MKKGESDITDLPKSFLISRRVEDPVSGLVFRQFQFVGQKAIDPVRSALLSDLPKAEWEKEIAPELAKMALQYGSDGKIVELPLDQLPVVYEFEWLRDQPQQCGEYPNGRPKRTPKQPIPEPEASQVVDLSRNEDDLVDVSLLFRDEILSFRIPFDDISITSITANF